MPLKSAGKPGERGARAWRRAGGARGSRASARKRRPFRNPARSKPGTPPSIPSCFAASEALRASWGSRTPSCSPCSHTAPQSVQQPDDVSGHGGCWGPSLWEPPGPLGSDNGLQGLRGPPWPCPHSPCARAPAPRCSLSWPSTHLPRGLGPSDALPPKVTSATARTDPHYCRGLPAVSPASSFTAHVSPPVLRHGLCRPSGRKRPRA